MAPLARPLARLTALSRPRGLLDALRAFPAAETALWAPALIVAGLTLADYVAVMQTETHLRAAASRAAQALGAGQVDAMQAAAMVRRDVGGTAADSIAVSVSMGDRAAVEVRLPTDAATLFGFHWFLPDDRVGARAEVALQDRRDAAVLVRD